VHNTDGIINKLPDRSGQVVRVFAWLHCSHDSNGTDVKSPAPPIPLSGTSSLRSLSPCCDVVAPRAAAFYETLCTITSSLLARNFVPPISLRSCGARRETRKTKRVLYPAHLRPTSAWLRLAKQGFGPQRASDSVRRSGLRPTKSAGKDCKNTCPRLRFTSSGQAYSPCTPDFASLMRGTAPTCGTGHGVTTYRLKHKDPARMLRRVTLTELYRRAVSFN